MQLDAGVALVAEHFGRNLELRVDFVDDGAGPSSTLVIHRRDFLLAAGIPVFLEDDDLGILSAQFNDRIHLGVQLFDCERDCGDFLYELGADQVGQRAPTRSGNEDTAVVRSNADFLLHAFEEFQQLLRLLGLVPLVVLPDDLVSFGVDDDRLHRRRANIHADRVDGRATSDLARLGQNPRRNRIGGPRRPHQGRKLDVNLGFASVAGSVLVRL